MREPIRYCDWCKHRLDWDQKEAEWVCSNPDCGWKSGAWYDERSGKKRPSDTPRKRGQS